MSHNGFGGGNLHGESTHNRSIPRLRLNSAPSTYWPRAQARNKIRTMLRYIPCLYPPLSSDDCPNLRYRRWRGNKPSHSVSVPTERDRQAMSFLEKKVEDLKLMVPGEVRRYPEFSFCNDANFPRMTLISRMVATSRFIRKWNF